MDYKVTDTELTNVANAIRDKGNTSLPLTWVNGFVSAINAIPSGGGDDNYKIMIGAMSGSITDNEMQSIRYGAFYSCQTLTEATFHSASIVASAAFWSCQNLSKVDIPLCESTSNEAFYNCTALSNVNMPLLKDIGAYAFESCAFESVYFSEAVYVGNSAFRYCSNLKTASFPKCSWFGSAAFGSAHQFESLYLLGSSIPTLGYTNVFNSTPMSASSWIGHWGSIYVPSSLVDTYKSANRWSVFSDRIVGI